MGEEHVVLEVADAGVTTKDLLTRTGRTMGPDYEKRETKHVIELFLDILERWTAAGQYILDVLSVENITFH